VTRVIRIPSKAAVIRGSLTPVRSAWPASRRKSAVIRVPLIDVRSAVIRVDPRPVEIPRWTCGPSTLVRSAWPASRRKSAVIPFR